MVWSGETGSAAVVEGACGMWDVGCEDARGVCERFGLETTADGWSERERERGTTDSWTSAGTQRTICNISQKELVGCRSVGSAGGWAWWKMMDSCNDT